MNREVALEMVARTVHEAMRAHQGALGEPEAPPWKDSGWMQASSREAVEFALGNPTPGAQHEAWMQSKQRDGWVRGPVKDEAQKTHPSLVPFEELSDSEQSKDALLIAVVQAVAPIVGLST
jgi:RyR domain